VCRFDPFMSPHEAGACRFTCCVSLSYLSHITSEQVGEWLKCHTYNKSRIIHECHHYDKRHDILLNSLMLEEAKRNVESSVTAWPLHIAPEFAARPFVQLSKFPGFPGERYRARMELSLPRLWWQWHPDHLFLHRSHVVAACIAMSVHQDIW
jgi:hypothetical protein